MNQSAQNLIQSFGQWYKSFQVLKHSEALWQSGYTVLAQKTVDFTLAIKGAHSKAFFGTKIIGFIKFSIFKKKDWHKMV